MNECPVCKSVDVRHIISLDDIPVICNELWATPETARSAPMGKIDLVCCGHCSMIWNHAFDPSRVVYAPSYENALHFSPMFQSFANELANCLIERHDLKGKTIFEIGCGDGYFLDLMSQLGVAKAIGLDPSMKDRNTPFADRSGVEIRPELFDSSKSDHQFDFIVCRHVLEHLEDPLSFLQGIRKAIGNRNVPVYLEVPNAQWMLESLSLWDVIYEHVGYWSKPSIKTLLHRSGFHATSVSTGYSDQFLMVEAAPSETEPMYVAPEADVVLSLSETFSQVLDREVELWRNRLAELDGKAVIWGAGSKGITFANIFSDVANKIVALIDVNPRKTGKYIPGVALPIFPPEQMEEIDLELVLISNGLYKDEIKAQVHMSGVRPLFGTISE